MCREDIALAAHLPSEDQRQALFRNIASAAESGWDFSSRWCSDKHDLSSIRTTQMIPVDLNVYIFKMEEIASRLALDVRDGMALLVRFSVNVLLFFIFLNACAETVYGIAVVRPSCSKGFKYRSLDVVPQITLLD